MGGNFWSDYNGTDTDDDGLGNTFLPYIPSVSSFGDGDNLPLVVPPPLACGSNVAFSRALDGDLLNCPADGLSIVSDNVILDCQGHQITGPGAFSYPFRSGIYTKNRKNITIKNCQISDFFYGINISSTNESLIVNNTLIYNNYGIRAENSSNNFIGSNSESYGDQDAFQLRYGGFNTLYNNTAYNNIDLYGFRLISSNNNTIVSNIADKNGGGFVLQGGSNNTMTNNTARNSQWFGVQTGGTYHNINNNLAENNQWDGFIIGDLYSQVNNNLARNNKRAGILLSSAYSLVTNNTLRNNTDGIKLQSSYATIAENLIENNTEVGINATPSSYNLIYNNIVRNNKINAYQKTGYAINYWNANKDCTKTNIIGGPCIGGNYWDDYKGRDVSGDGLGDTNLPYNSSGNISDGGDLRPLTDVNYTGEIFCGLNLHLDTSLNEDLACSAGGLIIDNHNLTLDCRGHRITSVAGMGTGIASDSKKNITIKNCIVDGFVDGIHITNVMEGHIVNNTINNVSNSGITIGNTSDSSIENNRITNISTYGIYTTDVSNSVFNSNVIQNYGVYGFYLTASSNSNITATIVNGGGYYGFYLYSYSKGNIVSNIVDDNLYGIILERVVNSTVKNNMATNSGTGFSISGYNYTLDSNIANNNSNSGFSIVSTSGSTINNNTAEVSGYSGFSIGASFNNTLKFNKINNFNSSGLNVYGSDFNSLESNSIEFLHDTINKQQGLVITSSFFNNIAESNTINGLPILYFDGLTRSCPNNTAYTNASAYGFMGFVGCNNITIKDSSPLDEVLLAFVTNSLIDNVNISFKQTPLEIIESDYVTVSNSLFSNNVNYGISISSSNNTRLVNNTASFNFIGIHFSSGYNSTIINNGIENNNNGLNTYYANDLTIMSNEINSNDDGLVMQYAQNSLVKSNVIENNSAGLSLYFGSTNNLIYDNLFNNSINSRDTEFDTEQMNLFNTTKTVGRNIVGGPYLGGNYWSDYSGIDTDEDGLGDTAIPHNSSGNILHGGDFLPLVIDRPPRITILSPLNSSNFIHSVIPLNFTVDEPTSSMSYSLNNQPNVSTSTSTFNLSIVLVNTYNLTVFANDTSGNMGKSDTVFFRTCVGDLDNSGGITILDVARAAFAFDTNSTNVTGKWDPLSDIDEDNDVDIIDIATMAFNFDKICV